MSRIINYEIFLIIKLWRLYKYMELSILEKNTTFCIHIFSVILACIFGIITAIHPCCTVSFNLLQMHFLLQPSSFIQIRESTKAHWLSAPCDYIFFTCFKIKMFTKYLAVFATRCCDSQTVVCGLLQAVLWWFLCGSCFCILFKVLSPFWLVLFITFRTILNYDLDLIDLV